MGTGMSGSGRREEGEGCRVGGRCDLVLCLPSHDLAQVEVTE